MSVMNVVLLTVCSLSIVFQLIGVSSGTIIASRKAHQLSIPKGHLAVAGIHATMLGDAIKMIGIQIRPDRSMTASLQQLGSVEYARVEIIHDAAFCKRVADEGWELIARKPPIPAPSMTLVANADMPFAQKKQTMPPWKDRAFCALVAPAQDMYSSAFMALKVEIVISYTVAANMKTISSPLTPANAAYSQISSGGQQPNISTSKAEPEIKSRWSPSSRLFLLIVLIVLVSLGLSVYFGNRSARPYSSLPR